LRLLLDMRRADAAAVRTVLERSSGPALRRASCEDFVLLLRFLRSHATLLCPQSSVKASSENLPKLGPIPGEYTYSPGPAEECSVCLEPCVRRLAILPCGHWFHVQCLKRWHASTTGRNHQTCPNCRQPAPNDLCRADLFEADQTLGCLPSTETTAYATEIQLLDYLTYIELGSISKED